MGAPRRVVPGTTYKTTRRTLMRQMLMVPCEVTNQIFIYCLAVVLKRFSIQLHSVIVLSNHYHLILTDPLGEISRFKQNLNYLLACVFNAYHSRRGPFFHPGSFSAVALTDDPELDLTCEDLTYEEFDQSGDYAMPSADDIVSGIDYVNLNSVTAGLVSHRDQWPGLHTSYMDIANQTAFKAKRPEFYFAGEDEDEFPLEASFQLTPPPQWAQLSSEDLRAVCLEHEAELDRREEAIRQQFAREGRTFLGPELALAQDPSSYPRSEEEPGQLNPRVAGRDKKSRTRRIEQLTLFRKRHRECVRLYTKEDDKTVTFPRGTYWMRYHFEVNVEDPHLCVQPYRLPP